MKRALAAAAVVAALAPAAFAAPESALPRLKTEVKTVAVFKNGLGFVIRAGETRLQDGWAVMEAIPPAALGTLWFGTTSAGGPVDRVVAFKEKVSREFDAVDMDELLAANVGKTATITYSVGQEAREVSGRILSAPKSLPPDESVFPLIADPRNSPGQIVLVEKAGGGTLVIRKPHILTVDFGADTNVKTKIEQDAILSKVHLRGEPSSAELTMAYLEKGLTWTPGYLVDISDEKEAEITLEAVFANDSEDIEGASVSFVVGYPSFAFSDQMSPLALQQNVQQIVDRLAAAPAAARYGSVMSQSMGLANMAYTDFASFATPAAMPGEANEDLYFYRQDNVTLKKGDRSRFLVFSEKVPYEHIYEWDVPDTMNVNAQGNTVGGPEQIAEQVWHSLRLTNGSKQPWTTGPALVVREDSPVSQGTLKYTSAGGKQLLKLTVATDVRGDQTQVEKSRKPVEIVQRFFDEVEVEGTLKVKNFKAESIRLNVKKALVGEVLTQSEGGKVTRVAKSLTAHNPNSELEWEFDLGAREERVLTYRYKVFVVR